MDLVVLDVEDFGASSRLDLQGTVFCCFFRRPACKTCRAHGILTCNEHTDPTVHSAGNVLFPTRTALYQAVLCPFLTVG